MRSAHPSFGNPSPARNEFIDHLKGLLILLVVWGHAIQHLAYMDHRFWADPIFRLIYIFHMPLFMAVSGYVGFGAIQRIALPAYASRRGRQVLIPILCWTIAFRLLLDGLGWLMSGAPQPGAWLLTLGHNLRLEFWLRLWFLWAVFFAAMITAGLRTMGLDRWPAFLLVTVASLFLPDEANLGLMKNVLPFYFVGYLFARRPMIPSGPLECRLLWGGLAATLVAWLAWKPEFHPYLANMKLTPENAGLLAFRFAAAGVASATFVLLAWRFYWPGRIPVLVELGRESLGIYILQTYVFFGIRWAVAPFDPRVLALVLGFPAALVIALGLARMIGLSVRSPVIARWFFGRGPGIAR